MSRVSALERHRVVDARNRTLSQRRIEKALAQLIDPENPRSVVSRVDGLYSILEQIAGVVKFLKIAGGVLTTLLVVFELIQLGRSLGWIH